jgi:toxin ParE1/3/4
VKLRYSRKARSDIARILAYLDDQSPQGRQRVEMRLRAALETLPTFPFAGGATSRTGIRRLLVSPYPYAALYRVMADEIRVLTVRHTARRRAPI